MKRNRKQEDATKYGYKSNSFVMMPKICKSYFSKVDAHDDLMVF
jgi:hypothetical protein